MGTRVTFLLLLSITAGYRLILLSLHVETTAENPSLFDGIRNVAVANLLAAASSPSADTPSGNDSLALSPDCRYGNTTNLFPRLPTFIIVGAQKTGTSALHHILKHHPQIIGSRGLEPHFFDTRSDILADLDSNERICQALHEYSRFFDMERIMTGVGNNSVASIITFEKTPSYMVYPHIPGIIKKLCPWVKIIISLRDPVDRLHSSYFEDDFDAEVDRQLDDLRRAGLIHAPPLRSFVPGSEDPKQFAVTKRIRRTHNQKGKVASRGVFRGLYSLQIVHWLRHFQLGTSLKVIKDFHRTTNRSKVLNEILEFVGATPFEFDESTLSAVYGPNNGPNRKARAPLRFKTRYYLKTLYRPYNEELASYLGEEWRRIWD
jgi:hypothetical protein